MKDRLDLGLVTISNTVVRKIVTKATLETDGVNSIAKNTSDLAKLVRRKKLTRGIEIEETETIHSITIRIVVNYGINMQNICKQVQANVRANMERFIGQQLFDIHVTVEGVTLTD